jgi:hypothetical protein
MQSRELTKKIDESQVDLHAIRMSVDTRTKSLLETVTDTREYLHEETDLTIQGMAQMMKTVIDTTRQGPKAKIVEVEAGAEHGIGTDRRIEATEV